MIIIRNAANEHTKQIKVNVTVDNPELTSFRSLNYFYSWTSNHEGDSPVYKLQEVKWFPDNIFPNEFFKQGVLKDLVDPLPKCDLHELMILVSDRLKKDE